MPGAEASARAVLKSLKRDSKRSSAAPASPSASAWYWVRVPGIPGSTIRVMMSSARSAKTAAVGEPSCVTRAAHSVAAAGSGDLASCSKALKTSPARPGSSTTIWSSAAALRVSSSESREAASTSAS